MNIELSGRRVAVLGAGRSGLAAARLILHHGGLPHVYEARSKECPDWPQDIPLTTGATEEDGHACDPYLVVISPGVETLSPFVRSFCKHGSPLIGEIELAYHFYKGTIIGITGTNGKTTSTELIEKILLADGKTAVACGNYGLPFAEVVMMNPQPDYVSLELSSFQLETIVDFRPKVAIWLNFAPDHMDRYTSVAEYFEAKRHIFDNQTAEDTAIVRLGEDFDLGDLKAPLYTFSAELNQGDLSYRDNAIWEGDTPLLSLQGTKMNIKHNAENVMVSLLATRALGIPLEALKKTLLTFAPPLHRCELIRILDNVEYVNDSKATNIHALEAALRSQTKPVVLIAGGKDKGLDYHGLLPLLKEKVHAVVVFGQIAPQLEETFSPVVPVYREDGLKATVERAQKTARPGDIVLFSPGTSSFDMFSGYEERGDCFRSIVLDLSYPCMPPV